MCRKASQGTVVSLSILTHGEQAPGDGGRGEAGEDVVGAGEVGEVRQDHRLAPALAPHVHVPALGLGGGRVRRVAGCDLHYPEIVRIQVNFYNDSIQRKVIKKFRLATSQTITISLSFQDPKT